VETVSMMVHSTSLDLTVTGGPLLNPPQHMLGIGP